MSVLGAFYHLVASVWETADCKMRMWELAFDFDTVAKFRMLHLQQVEQQGLNYHELDHDIRTCLRTSRSRYIDIL